MDPEFLRGFLRIGIFVGGCGLLMAFVQPRDSAEFVLSVCSAAIGGVLVLGVVVLMRVMGRPTAPLEDESDDWRDVV